jgi:hypothetical protein
MLPEKLNLSAGLSYIRNNFHKFIPFFIAPKENAFTFIQTITPKVSPASPFPFFLKNIFCQKGYPLGTSVFVSVYSKFKLHADQPII